jgi:hypothetical protein
MDGPLSKNLKAAALKVTFGMDRPVDGNDELISFFLNFIPGSKSLHCHCRGGTLLWLSTTQTKIPHFDSKIQRQQ